MKMIKVIIENQVINIFISIILTAIIFYIDWITGIDFNIYAFYVFPLFILSLNRNNKLPVLFLASFLIGILWIIEDFYFRIIINKNYSFFLLFWNGIIRIIFYGSIALTFYIIKAQREKLHNTNQKLANAIEEKNILFKEVYHRIKNNLQIIISLLSLEKNNKNKRDIIDVLNNSISRIQSMSIIHEKLYKSENLARICVKEYINGLIANLLQNYNTGKTIIKYEIKLSEELFFDMDRMIPLGLILNELTMNSIKHAFPGKKEGAIIISIKLIGSVYYLSYSDNGIGFKVPVDFEYAGTLGITLISLLTKQLKGSLEIKNNGHEFVISFIESSS